MPKRRRSRLGLTPFLTFSIAFVLVACGGGGGSSSDGGGGATGGNAGGSGSGTTTTLPPDTNGVPGFAPGTAPSSPTHWTPVSSSPVAEPPAGTALNGSSCSYQYSLTGSSQLTGADPLLAQQWHLQNTGQSGGRIGEDIRAVAAWLLAPGRGLGARVSVVDDAIEVVHDDLAPNVVSGASFNYRTTGLAQYPLPCGANDDHGTAVAGLAVARDGNALGGAGVAPRAALAAFNALATNKNFDISDALLRDQGVNGVYNNSWGAADNALLHVVDSNIKVAVNDGLANGRAGKGSVYVFPGGNGGCFGGGAINANDECLSDSDNANFDGYVNRYGVITACAVSDQGKKPWYGEPGANLLVCGSSSNLSGNVVSTAVRNGYLSDFSGTSATAPMVSGVVALMLSVRPELTYRDVMLILARTARQNDPDDAGWVTANGLHFNHKYGFGVVDAAAAVQAVPAHTSVGGFADVLNCGWYRQDVGKALPDGTKPANTPVSDIIAVPADCAIRKIEFVEIALVATHAYSGDLRIRLTSPAGLSSDLANERVCIDDISGRSKSCGNYDSNWLFGSNRHLDEAAPGNWTMRITDVQSSDTGTWNHWSIRFWGRR